MADLITNHHDLCLACSSSLRVSEKVFTTPCCRQSICTKCVSSNPRLTRYNPCLACLGGVGVIAAGKGKVDAIADTNIDGALRDEDTFVVGDGDDDDEVPPPYPATTDEDEGSAQPLASATAEPDEQRHNKNPGPSQYYIKRTDTLQGIALRFGVDGRELCKMNNLPFSTLSITPHLLHTRDCILLPLSAKTVPTDLNHPTPDEQRRREARRAEKRLQLVTKEADWRVARAYVALADAEHTSGDFEDTKNALKARDQNVESRALDQYLDDAEWEARAGQPRIQGFPYFSQKKDLVGAGPSRWKFNLW